MTGGHVIREFERVPLTFIQRPSNVTSSNVTAQLDPAIHRYAKKIYPRVRPAGDA
jgi:hypothetical protein